MLNLCWFKKKFFFSVLGVFGKYFVFTKIENFQKQCCPVLVTQSQVIQVACYSRELACWFWRLVRKWKVQSRGVHRNFRGSARDFLVGRPSNREKHWENFFSILSLSVLAACLGDLMATCFNREKRVFCISKTVFKTFSVFPSNLWLFIVFPISLSTEIDPNTPQTPFLHHFLSNLQEKGMGFLCLTSFSMFWVCFSCFYECIGVIMFLKSVMLVQGFALS